MARFRGCPSARAPKRDAHTVSERELARSVYHSETTAANSPIAALNLSDFPHVVPVATPLQYSQCRAATGNENRAQRGPNPHANQNQESASATCVYTATKQNLEYGPRPDRAGSPSVGEGDSGAGA